MGRFLRFCLRPKILLGLGLLFGALFTVHRISGVSLFCGLKYPHLNPAERCESGPRPFMKSYEAFKGDTEKWIAEQEKTGKIDEAAVYFRDLENGPWFGIRESEAFLPASLFKVPVMIAVLKAIEKKPSFAAEELGMAVLPDVSRDSDDPNRTIEAGKYYTIDQLLERMIIYSDNLSMDLLERRLLSLGSDGISARDLYRDLGLLPAEDAQTVSVFSYSSLFRILYNARYLSRESSEKALSILSRSDFKQGIVAGVPQGVQVAHKFGIHNSEEESSRLFHDCGIVYHPQRPYMLCIMTKGDDINKSVLFIAELSRRVYEQVEQHIRIAEW